MLILKNYISLIFLASLLVSCFQQNTNSSLRSDDRLTVDVAIDTVDKNQQQNQEQEQEQEQDKLKVNVGIDSVDPNNRDDGSIGVSVEITTKPLEEPEEVEKKDTNEDISSLEKDNEAIKLFVEPQGMDIRMELSANLSVEAVEFCLGEVEQCLSAKGNISFLRYEKSETIGTMVFFRNKKAPSTEKNWVIIAKDINNQSLFYRAVKVGS